MLRRVSSLPFFVLLLGIGAVAMLVPALHAYGRSDFGTARIFLYATILGLFLSILIGLATTGYAPRSVPRSQVVTLVAAYAVLPLLFAIPFYEAARPVSFLNAWFEMVSSFTTTGATIFDNPRRINPSLHLWRATVGWLGGLFIWITAVAVLAPMNLGGFEVRSPNAAGDLSASQSQISRLSDPAERLARYSLRLVPIYAGLTLALWVGLMLAGEVPLVAICHAMSVLATSGISPVGGVENGASGLAGEMLIFAFLLFALTRLTFSKGLLTDQEDKLVRDPELQLALVLIGAVALLLFLRHFVSSADRFTVSGTFAALGALWGALFTALSFLTTTGFESRQWLGATDWAGLRSPGLVLVGLAIVGGGVATTAGGVKLLRVYTLYKHGMREFEKLVHPNSVGTDGSRSRRIRRRGAYISWIFFMLFALSIVVVMGALSLTGMQFEAAMVLAVSAISTTGPLAQVAAEIPVSYAGIPDSAKTILAATMVLGRLETLALIALLNPDVWRS